MLSDSIGFKWQRPNGSWVNKREIRIELFKQQNGKCFYCKRQMSFIRKKNGQPAKDFATFEHLVRKQNGGLMNETNMVLACKRCNIEREMVRQSNNGKNKPSNMPLHKWKVLLERWKLLEGSVAERLKATVC